MTSRQCNIREAFPQPDQAVTMSFRTVDGTAKTSDSDYVARTGTLTFAVGETTKTITIEVKGDTKKESNETFYLAVRAKQQRALHEEPRRRHGPKRRLTRVQPTASAGWAGGPQPQGVRQPIPGPLCQLGTHSVGGRHT